MTSMGVKSEVDTVAHTSFTKLSALRLYLSVKYTKGNMTTMDAKRGSARMNVKR